MLFNLILSILHLRGLSMLEYAPISITQPVRSRQPWQQYISPTCCSCAHCKVAGLAVHICRCVVYNFITIYFIEIQIKNKSFPASCWTTSCTQSSTGRTCSTTKNIRRFISAHNTKVAAVMESQLWPPATDQASVLPIRSSSADTALVNYERDFVNHSVKTPSRNFLADPIRLPFRNIIQHVSSISKKIRTVTDQILM